MFRDEATGTVRVAIDSEPDDLEELALPRSRHRGGRIGCLGREVVRWPRHRLPRPATP